MTPLTFPTGPQNGQPFQKFVYNSATNTWNIQAYQKYIDFEYVVIAGGGSGYQNVIGAGGGAGGYRSSVSGELSGGGTAAERKVTIEPGKAFTVTVGAGGTTGAPGTNGENSVFHTVTSLGGGYGGRISPAGNGGSGGGTADLGRGGVIGLGASSQGFNGGQGTTDASTYTNCGGGGGAGGLGQNANGATSGGNGGAGVSSSITGTSVPRAGGGAGTAQSGTAGTGGSGGGGNVSSNGGQNTGGGGGGNGGAGGSGVVILKYPDFYTLTINAGLTATTDAVTVPGYKITTFTAGTDTVTVGI